MCYIIVIAGLCPGFRYIGGIPRCQTYSGRIGNRYGFRRFEPVHNGTTYVELSRKAVYITESVSGRDKFPVPALYFFGGGQVKLKQQKNKKKVKKNYSAMRCPYCGAGVVYRSADGIYRENQSGTMLYVCSNYPKCGAYMRVDKNTGKPVGTMADQKLRALRNAAHQYFDRLHQSGTMTKQEAYQWLAYLIAAPLSEAHIGRLGEYYCGLVIEESRKLMGRKKGWSINCC